MCRCLINWVVWYAPQWHFTVTEYELKTIFFKFLFSKSKFKKEGNQNIYFLKKVTDMMKKWNKVFAVCLTWIVNQRKWCCFILVELIIHQAERQRRLKLNAAAPELLSRLMFALMLFFMFRWLLGNHKMPLTLRNVSAKHSEVASKRDARLNTDLRV